MYCCIAPSWSPLLQSTTDERNYSQVFITKHSTEDFLASTQQYFVTINCETAKTLPLVFKPSNEIQNKVSN